MGFKSTEDLHPYRKQILELAEKHGASHVRVFGSIARGEASDTSDVDLLVKWDYERVSAWGGIGLDDELQSLLGCPVDVISEAGLSPLLKEQILAEAIPL